MSDVALYHEIVCETLGPVRRILLNRPQLRNAQNRTMLDEIDAAFAAAAADPTIRVIILAAAGDHFSAGHDLKEAQRDRSHQSAEQRFHQEEAKYYQICMHIHDCPKPTLAQVQGACLAGGLMLAGMCDLIVAAEDAFFSDPTVHSVSLASLEVLAYPFYLGPRRAKDLLLTGRRLPASEALQFGLVNRVVPRAELESTTLKLAEHIAKAAPFAVRLAKRSVNRMMDMAGFRTALEAHFDTHQVTHHSDEFAAVINGSLANSIDRGKALR
ncbi:enoyl-CoA hydratase [Peristeroidobacter soli]|jgi:enoyl-CoA hydratase|uniref:enoyl-CoA hydratase n=1 Tax=Peristeroidobacter soli TaxID=2497877 RepID=UPI00101BEA58|nr:enoyl-CoA hydratase [Peristeroidobacter soli]